MGKSFAELSQKRNDLYELKETAVNTGSEEARTELRGKIIKGANELLSSTGEFSPVLTKSDGKGKEEELSVWRSEIRLPAEALRLWAVRFR